MEKTYCKLGNLDLNSSPYAIQDISLPPPPITRSWAGETMFRDGELMTEHRFGNRTIQLTLAILCDTEAQLRSAIRDLYDEVLKETNVLEYRPPGSSKSLYFDTFTGTAEVAAAPDGMWVARLVERVVVTLPAKPFARGDEVVLFNRILNGNFERGSPPDSWSALGTATISRWETGVYGRYCLQIAGSAAGDGAAQALNWWYSSSGDTIVLSAWVWVSSGVLRMRLKDITNNVVRASTTSTASSWTQISLSWTNNVGSINLQVEFVQDTATALTAYIDGVYLSDKNTTPPEAWSSYAYLYNHDDSDIEHAGVLEVAGVPGDVPAACALSMWPIGQTPRWVYWGFKSVDADIGRMWNTFAEAEDFMTNVTDISDTEASAGAFSRFSPTGGGQKATGKFLVVGTADSKGFETHKGEYTVYARVRVNDTDQNFKMRVRPEAGVVKTWLGDWSDYVTKLPMGEWGIVRLGTITLPPFNVPDDLYAEELYVGIEAKSLAGTGTLDMDYFFLCPLETGGVAYFSQEKALSDYLSISTIVDPPALFVEESPLAAARYVEGVRGLEYIGTHAWLKPGEVGHFLIQAQEEPLPDFDAEDAVEATGDLWFGPGDESLGQAFHCDANCSPKVVWLYLRRVGSPTNNLTVKIMTDDGAGLPSGTVVTNGTSSSVAMSGIDTDWEWVAFSFPTPPSLTGGTRYHITLWSDQTAEDPDNYIQWGTTSDDEYYWWDDYHGSYYTSATWFSPGTYDRLFRFSYGGHDIHARMGTIVRYRPRYILVP